jgi:hypothetical protein
MDKGRGECNNLFYLFIHLHCLFLVLFVTSYIYNMISWCYISNLISTVCSKLSFLEKGVLEHGTSWSKIAPSIVGRTYMQCCNQWRIIRSIQEQLDIRDRLFMQHQANGSTSAPLYHASTNGQAIMKDMLLDTSL